MARYTLNTLCRGQRMERFEYRPVIKLLSILAMPKHHMAGEVGAFKEKLNHPDSFEIYNSQMTKIFEGDVNAAIAFVRKLK